MSKKYSVLWIMVLITVRTLIAQETKPDLIQWVTMEKAQELYKKTPRPTLIYFYTDWCRYCKEMERTTFSNEQISAYINQNFYCIKVNAEGYDTIIFNDTTYINPGGGTRSTHEFARKMLGTRLTYPTSLFLNNQYQFRFVVPGMIDIVKLEPILVYVLENVFYTELYEPFEQQFIQTFRPDTTEGPISPMETGTFQDLDFSKKKIISLEAPWCNSCKVMNRSVFQDSLVADLTQKYYSVVSMPVTYTDTIHWHGEVYPPDPAGGVHSFVLHFSNKQLLLPMMFMFDEEGKLLTPLPRYQPAKSLAMIMRYFGEGHYPTVPWGEYQRENGFKN